MPAAPARVLLLPERRRFSGQSMSIAFARYARRFTQTPCHSGEAEQLQRYFHGASPSWPMAALLREHAFADGSDDQWLCADPVYIQAEIGSARMMACEGLLLGTEHKQALLSAFRPLFGDAGFEFGAGLGDGFFIRALNASPLPQCPPAYSLLGCDIHKHLPQDRKWLALFNECQIILHNHPLNVQRQRQGQLPINAFWFWGAGVLPARLGHVFSRIDSTATDINALAAHADIKPEQAPCRLIDLRHCRNWLEVEAQFDPSASIVFDFSDGQQWRWQSKFRWYFWRYMSGFSDTFKQQ